jgi:hypothetical protein
MFAAAPKRKDGDMATVTITIVDSPDNMLDIGIESDPPFPGPAAMNQVLTEAQMTGLELVEKVVGVAARKK